LKLNGTHQLLVYADDDILGRSIHTTKENAEAFVMASKKIGLNVNADNTVHVVIPLDQNAGQSHTIKIGNSLLSKNLKIKIY